MPPAQGRRLEMAFHRREYLHYISHVGSKKAIYQSLGCVYVGSGLAVSPASRTSEV